MKMFLIWLSFHIAAHDIPCTFQIYIGDDLIFDYAQSGEADDVSWPIN